MKTVFVSVDMECDFEMMSHFEKQENRMLSRKKHIGHVTSNQSYELIVNKYVMPSLSIAL